MNQLPFELPDEPVDKYRVEWWTLNVQGVQAHHAIYHVNSTWEEICPDDERPGAPFINHWQLFTNGHFDGRSVDGWTKALGFLVTPWNRIENYTTRAEAEKAHRKILNKEIEIAQERIAEAEAKLAKLDEKSP